MKLGRIKEINEDYDGEEEALPNVMDLLRRLWLLLERKWRRLETQPNDLERRRLRLRRRRSSEEISTCEDDDKKLFCLFMDL